MNFFHQRGPAVVLDEDAVYEELPRFHVPNKRVALEPFPEERKSEIRNGVLVMVDKKLTPLRVIFGSDEYPEGAIVYVRTALQRGSLYGKEVFEAEGRKFILVPEDEVVLIDYGPLMEASAPEERN